MSAASHAPVDPRFANLDANATVELCSSLADYGEAGGLSRDLMLQVGRFAESRHGDELEVLLAVGRMYLHGGDPALARDALVRAGQLGLDEARVIPLLDQALAQLDDPRSAEQALGDAPSRWDPPRSPKATGPRPTPRAVAKLPSAKDVSERSYTPTSPMLRMPGHGPSKATTPIVRRRPVSPVPVRPDRPVRPVRTEISRRVARDADTVSRSSPPPPLSASNLPRPARIRILDPDDDRRRLDPYEIIGELASGGMATVYLGRLAGAGGFSRFVAIKQLHPHLAREEQFVQMFLDEARLAAGIHDAHVVPILEVGTSKAGYFLVMEFIEGDTLAGLTLRALHLAAAEEGEARSPALPAPVAIRIVLDALAGLHAAHQLTDAEGVHLGLVHRDCTPQNILVGVDGSARLTDFGVARAASRLAITRPQQVKGKVAYLSPEQAHAMDLDRRSDLFTMGIVLWEALAGRSLFQADNEAVTLSQVVSSPIPAVRSFAPDLPPALDDVCRRALHRDRSKRFRTAAEMADALELAASAVGVASPRELGRFVEATMGPDLTAQREAVRAGLAPSVKSARPSRPPPSLRGSAAELPAPALAVEATPSAIPAVDPSLTPTLPAAAAPAELARAKPPTMSPARGVALALLLVLVLTAPLWIKVTQRIMHRHQTTGATP